MCVCVFVCVCVCVCVYVCVLLLSTYLIFSWCLGKSVLRDCGIHVLSLKFKHCLDLCLSLYDLYES